LADILRIFDWLALLAIGMMSITIPTYAISVSFLGRESKRTLLDLERRRGDLEKKTKELTATVGTGPGLIALKAEIAQYEKDINQMKGRLTSLSVWGAFVYPVLCFAVALLSAGYGFLVYSNAISSFEPSLTGDAWVFFSIVFSLLGIVFLGNTLFRVNQAALSPETLSSFRVSFENGSTVERFPLSTPSKASVLIHNFGKEMAENVMIMIFFPTGFTTQPGLYSQGVQPPYPVMDYPGWPSVSAVFDDMHEDTINTMAIGLVTPTMRDKYKIPIYIWEKRLGKSVHELVIEVY